MELIIEIDEQVFTDLQNGYYHLSDIAYAVKNGTPLPKGHGDLIDREELSPKIHGAKSIVAVLEAPAIIEADKESDNETDN